MARKSPHARLHPRPAPKPLDETVLTDLSLAYVARFATSAAKLRRYALRKLRERGWKAADAGDPMDDQAQAAGRAAIEVIIERFVTAGYLDDAAYALQTAGGLTRRGFGQRRVAQALHHAGISEEDRGEALDRAGAGRWQSALALARRRRLGPYGSDGPPADPAAIQRQMGALLRAGHDMDIARKIVKARSVEVLEAEACAEEDE